MKRPDINLADVRECVVELQEQGYSLRALGTEMDLCHTTLHNFVGGAEPHPKVRRKLVDWYLSRTGGRPDVTTASVALTSLIGLLPLEGQPAARAGFIDVVEQSFRGCGRAVPDWVGAFRGSPVSL
jgi:lambda repressor-like predicted transcriptional regulator